MINVYNNSFAEIIMCWFIEKPERSTNETTVTELEI